MQQGAERAYLTGLKLLARRELSEAQLRVRLERRFAAAEVDDALAQLRRERALDDRRMAVACARTEAFVRIRGRARILRQLETLGIADDTARAAVNEVFAEIDEASLMERAFERRLRRGVALDDPAGLRRVHRYLVGQGFDPSRVTALVKRRAKVDLIE
jgi:SOS response regulatory protein OraA/RecX